MKDVNVRIAESESGSVLRGIRQLPEKPALTGNVCLYEGDVG